MARTRIAQHASDNLRQLLTKLYRNIFNRTNPPIVANVEDLSNKCSIVTVQPPTLHTLYKKFNYLHSTFALPANTNRGNHAQKEISQRLSPIRHRKHPSQNAQV